MGVALRFAPMSASSDFRPGLEGVVAFETEIAEPDKDGGSLRYRGIDIEELVGRYPFENVWGLLVDEDINSPLPPSEPIELQDPSGSVPADLQAGLATLGAKWGLRSSSTSTRRRRATILPGSRRRRSRSSRRPRAAGSGGAGCGDRQG